MNGEGDVPWDRKKSQKQSFPGFQDITGIWESLWKMVWKEFRLMT